MTVQLMDKTSCPLRIAAHAYLIFCTLGTLANSEDPDEMPQTVAFHQDLHCLRRHLFHGQKIYKNLEILTCGLLICKMNHSKYFFLSNLDEESISTQSKGLNISNLQHQDWYLPWLYSLQIYRPTRNSPSLQGRTFPSLLDCLPPGNMTKVIVLLCEVTFLGVFCKALAAHHGIFKGSESYRVDCGGLVGYFVVVVLFFEGGGIFHTKL